MPAANFDVSDLSEEHALRATVARPLTELCLEVVAANFRCRPTLRGVPAQQVGLLSELLPTDLPLEVTAPLIDREEFWQRCALARWDNCVLTDHGCSWKRLYFERHLAGFLEAVGPFTEAAEVQRALATCKEYVFTLKIGQVLAPLDLEQLVRSLPSLGSLELTYAVKHIGMAYEKKAFGMKLSDASSLANALRMSETLSVLALPCSLLDDASVRAIAGGLAENCTLTSLDLSHNKIADRGAKALAKLLGESVLISLNLCDNRIHSDGGKYLGRALHANVSLRHLNLRLNRLGDEGGQRLIEGARKHAALTSLNLSCNALEEGAARAAAALLSGPSALHTLDLSANQLSEEAGRALHESMRGNTTVQTLDLRQNSLVADEALVFIEGQCQRNRQAAGG